MNVLDQKKLLIERILPYLTGAPSDAVNRLLQKSVSDLETILDDAITKRARAEAAEQVKQHADAMRRESALEGSWVNTIRNVWLNGTRRLIDCDSNRAMMESLIQPHETPSASLYSTIALTYPAKFSWQVPPPTKTDADRQVEFARICRENNLSECAANQQLHREGAAQENWAGASQVELQKFQSEAAQARQHFLIHSASPTQLKQEAAWESQQNRAAAVQAEADRQHQVSSQQQQQSGMFPPLPAVHAETGEAIDARWLRKTSTINFELFKRLCKRHGSAQITERLRTPAAPAV
jgi:hypothetical protein